MENKRKSIVKILDEKCLIARRSMSRKRDDNIDVNITKTPKTIETLEELTTYDCKELHSAGRYIPRCIREFNDTREFNGTREFNDSDSSLSITDSETSISYTNSSNSPVYYNNYYRSTKLYNSDLESKRKYLLPPIPNNHENPRPKRRQDYRAGCILISPSMRILCVRNVASGCWGFPKGRINSEYAEDTVTAALRELYEETSIRLRPEDLTLPVRKSKATLYIVHVGLESTFNVRVDNYECDNYEWLTLDELKKRSNSRLTREFFHRISLL